MNDDAAPLCPLTQYAAPAVIDWVFALLTSCSDNEGWMRKSSEGGKKSNTIYIELL